MLAVYAMFYLMSLHSISCSAVTSDAEKSEKARTALEYVEKVRNSACSGGTEETLPVEFDHAQWREYAEVAVRMSNTLTKNVIRHNNSLSGVSEEFLFDLVRNNVDNESPIFGSAIAIEEWIFPKYRIFCPYSYKKDTVYAHDISLNYNYLDPSTEWYHVLRMRNWSDAHVSENLVTYRFNMTSHDSQQNTRQPMALIADGHWTAPYYDCGGGDIWMVTYSSPIFGMDSSGLPIFKGIGTIDIELTNIDINQCDIDLDSQNARKTGSVDVFRGTHHCLSSTKCVPVQGKGFIPGAYKCGCQIGYYFPQTHLHPDRKFFNGSELEAIFANVTGNETLAEAEITGYRCLPCAEGCDACVDDSPCLYSYKLSIRVSLLILTILTVLLTTAASVLVRVHRSKRVIKSASPIFLHILTVGSALMAITMIIAYFEPNDVTCAVLPWIRHIGFSMAYGALLLKTWRIATIFRVKSARKVSLSDKVLAQRFIPILCVTLAYLAVWTIVSRPQVVWLRTAGSDLKFRFCQTSWWGYGAILGEGVFLLWGAYLCFVVRKAPSHFNESKYITWSIYNNILLGSFIIVAKEFIAMDQGPDIIYIVDFAYIQVVVTGLISLIFLPKLYGVYRNAGDAEFENETITGRTKTVPGTMIESDGAKPVSVATQTDWTGSPSATQKTINLTLPSNNKVAPLP